jgi:hypothetical protein
MGDAHMTAQGKSWREVIPVHPAAELFPLMIPGELKALSADIQKNGLAVPVILWEDPNDKSLSLLDGRNRLDAAEVAGLPVLDKDGNWLDLAIRYDVVRDGDPYELVLSANVHRRHLTYEEKHHLLVKVLKARPEKSNRAIAKQVKVDDKTVGSVRRELERRAEIPHVSTIEDTTGRKQPAQKPPSRKKRRTEDDYAREKKARLTLVHDTDAPAPASLEAEIVDCIESAIVEPIIKSIDTITTELTATAESTNDVTPTHTATLRKQFNALSTDVLAFHGAYSARVRDWCAANADNPYRSTLADIVKGVSVRMQELALQIEGRNSNSNDEAPLAAHEEMVS